MGSKNKLKRFKENLNFTNLFQPTRDDLIEKNFELRGKWNSFFKNDNPIVLELGCGKGEYTTELAKLNPNKNYIGIDIKGARIWKGAKESIQNNLNNVCFIRTQIELIDKIFFKQEISEIWITFPDPQVKFHRRNKRLTSPNFLKMYNQILQKGGVVNLKTDSQFLHGYTLGILETGPYKIIKSMHDIYNVGFNDNRLNIKTHYEEMFLLNKQPITYIQFSFL